MARIKGGKEHEQGRHSPTAPGTAGHNGKKSKKGVAARLLLGVAALGLVMFCAVKLLPGEPVSDEPHYVWVTEDGKLFVAPNSREKTKAVQVSDRAWTNAQAEVSPDGTWLYYMEQEEPGGVSGETGILCRISLTGKVKKNPVEKLGEDAVSFRQTKNGVLWLEKWGENYRLHCFDGGENRKLATLQEPVYELDGEETFAYYLSSKDDAAGNRVSIHRAPLAGGESETLAENVNAVYGDWTGQFLFTRWEEEAGSYAVYLAQGDGTWIPLAEHLSEERLMDVEPEDGISFSYLTLRTEEYKYSAFVTDRYAAEDAETLSATVEVPYPEEPTEPDWEDFGMARTFKESDGEWYYTSLNGSRTYHMEVTPEFIYEMTGYEVTEQMLNMYKRLLNEKIMSEAAGYMADILWERACAQYEAELEDWRGKLAAYHEAMERAAQAYREAMARETIRTALENGVFVREVNDLYRFEDGERILVASGLKQNSLVEDGGIYRYEKPLAEIGTLADVSELESAEELIALLGEKSSVYHQYRNENGAEKKLEP